MSVLIRALMCISLDQYIIQARAIARYLFANKHSIKACFV